MQKWLFRSPLGFDLDAAEGLLLCHVVMKPISARGRQLCPGLPLCVQGTGKALAPPHPRCLRRQHPDVGAGQNDSYRVVTSTGNKSTGRPHIVGENSRKFHNPECVLNYMLSTMKNRCECSSMWTPSDSSSLPAFLEDHCLPGASFITLCLTFGGGVCAEHEIQLSPAVF